MTSSLQICSLTPGDVDDMIALDRSLGTEARADFFHKRIQAMNSDSDAYLGFIAREENKICGYLLARILHGEFGAEQPVAVLDGLGVASDKQHSGIGDRLMQQLKTKAKEHGCHEVRTQANWHQQELLTYFANVGFSLAPRLVLKCTTDTMNA